MTPEDWLEIEADFTTVRDMNATSIVLRRGATTLAAQTVRIERVGFRAQIADSAGGQQASTPVVILGATTLDIQVNDRFTLSGVVYEVTFINPNRRAGTQAEATAVE